jgi:hypothetical protein
MTVPPPTTAPSDVTPWLGLWTEVRTDEEAYNRVLGSAGVPWAIRKLLQQFAAQREFRLPTPGEPLLFRSKMLTGSWDELNPDTPTVFSVLGYTVDTLVTGETGGRTLVSTMTTTAADGYVLSGWSTTTRITHELTEDGELEVNTIAPEGEYKFWMTQEASAPAASAPAAPETGAPAAPESSVAPAVQEA